LSIPSRRRIELVNRINAGFALGTVSGYHCLREVIGAEGFGVDYQDVACKSGNQEALDLFAAHGLPGS